ncbi:Ycf66 family protein [Synechococcus sp. 1G10]|uniref:Ycf66 family protein n=1 Tax=Synechococcus sp. 1G10 TaxID=2025605 RepID=UPI000B995568|nr:Ycf66 family protein [Synechococcus sp. 1G10]
MVNASLNWASIVGIVLAVGGAFLYFMRSFKPALARDYDVFFAAIGLLCGGILFFQGWRLDPILQFGQFLLAGTTVFFAYESVRLRGVTTEQARRSSYFDDDEPLPAKPRMGGRAGWDDDTDRFEEPQPLRRRIRSPLTEELEDDASFYRPRREAARPAIPERAASRRPPTDSSWDADEPSPRRESESYGSRSVAPSSAAASGAAFGSRRRERDSGVEPRRGSRPMPSSESMPRSSRRPGPAGATEPSSPSPGVPQGTPIRSRPSAATTNNPISSSAAGAGPAASPATPVSDADYTPLRPAPSSSRPRDNSSRFDS